jgi:hypothetical protein
MKLRHWYLPRRTWTVLRQKKGQLLRRLPLLALEDYLRGGEAEA